MAAAVNLGKEFSPKKLFLLENLQASSCLFQGGGRPNNPGSKYILSLPSPSPRPRLSQLNASRSEPGSSPAEPPWVHFTHRCAPKPGGMPCSCRNQPLLTCPAMNEPTSKASSTQRPADQWTVPKIHRAHRLSPGSQEADDLLMHLMEPWTLPAPPDSMYQHHFEPTVCDFS